MQQILFRLFISGKRWQSAIATALLAVLAVTHEASAQVVFESGPERVALLELYTSEGCSSCPPAERWISSLKRDEALWDQFVPVAFHVDYWDYIGWKDRFAKPEFGDRQRSYANEGGLRTVYTPGMMLNGKEWRGWIAKRPPVADSQLTGQLNAQVDNSTVQVDFSPATASHSTYTVHIALLAFEQSSDVGAGENRGRQLNNDFVVLALQEHSLIRHSNGYRVTSEIDDRRLPVAATAIAVWVTGQGSMAPLQATGGWLAAQ